MQRGLSDLSTATASKGRVAGGMVSNSEKTSIGGLLFPGFTYIFSFTLRMTLQGNGSYTSFINLKKTETWEAL